VLATAVAAGATMLASASAGGTGALVVTTTADSTDGACTASLCSLRDAVQASNAAGGGAVTVPAGRYVLTDGPLVVTSAISITGDGARSTTISGREATQVIRGDRSSAPSITLTGLTVTDGVSQSADAPDYNEGGGIVSWGPLTLDHVAVVGNVGAADGGGVDVQSDLTVVASTIANNTAAGDAGGLRAQNGTVSITSSTIAHNTAQNRAAIEIDFTSSATIRSTTVADNRNTDGTFGSLRVDTGSVTLEEVAIDNDLSDNAPNCVGTFVSAGHNVATDGSCGLTAAGDLASAASAGLGPLTDNGGDTDTMAPQAGSALVDGGGTGCPATDQRDEARPEGAACDVGAVETTGSSASSGLTQLAAPDDCIAQVEVEGCGTITGTGLKGADWIAASPDGANVYVASFSSGSVAELARASDGSLTELGCVAASGTECATTVPGLSEATSVAVSPDGKNVYVTGDSDDTVMIFDRNSTDGTLTSAGCLQDAAARFDRGCATTVHGMENAYDVVVSPDGKNVYVAAGGGFPELGGVVELARASDGSLTQLAAPDDCIEEQGSSAPVCGTSDGTGLLAATALVLSPDGASLYAVSDNTPGALATFDRDADTGALTATGCIADSGSECAATASGLSDLVNVAVSPDGATVYTASDDSTGPIAEFSRATDGTLTSLGCIDSGGSICATTTAGLAAVFGLAVSPDGVDVYAASAGGSTSAPGVVELARASDGTLSASDCIQQAGAASRTCTDTSGHGLGDALGVAVSPDGANVYVATDSSGGAVAAFSRAGGGTPPSNQPPTAAFTSSASDLAVSFDGSASSDADGTVVSYAWSFGDGSTGSGGTPSHAYAASGTFTVSLTVTDDGGTTASVSHQVSVTAPSNNPSPPASGSGPSGSPQPPPPKVIDIPPAAHVTVSPPTGNRRTRFLFSSKGSVGKIASYAWDFGDGTGASTTDAAHVYRRIGTYRAALTVTDSSGRTSTATANVVVKNAAPRPAFTYHTRSGRSVAFDGTSSFDPDGSVRSYRWSFGDGAIAVGRRTVVHHYRGAKTRYTVRLEVIDDFGARVHIRRSVTVLAGAGDITDLESILVTDVPGVTPPAGLTIIENIGVSTGTAP
jgi:CSLREA domain-containing protein